MRGFILLLLLFAPLLAVAHDPGEGDSKLCAPFRNGVVDPVIVNSMLEAAGEGRLYRIQPKSSEVGFCVDSMVGRVEAGFSGIQGGLALRRETWGDESQMLVMVDANSLAMDECFVKNMLKSEHFLDTRKYPRILFVSSGLHWLDSENAILKGMLTMHGVTRPVQFYVNLSMSFDPDTESAADIVVTAKSFINRSDFNMHRLRSMVSDTVELCMRVEASLFQE